MPPGLALSSVRRKVSQEYACNNRRAMLQEPPADEGSFTPESLLGEIGEGGAVVMTAESPESLDEPSREAVQTLLEAAARKCSRIRPTKRKTATVSPTVVLGRG